MLLYVVDSFYKPVIFLGTISVTEMAEVVISAQVFKQLVVVQVTFIAELAERVTPVTGVIRVSMRSVTGQFFPVVPLALRGEDLGGEANSKLAIIVHLVRSFPFCWRSKTTA